MTYDEVSCQWIPWEVARNLFRLCSLALNTWHDLACTSLSERSARVTPRHIHRRFDNAFVDECLMIQFPGDCSYPVVYGTLLHFYCCSSFLSLSLCSHWQAVSVAVDLRQIEFDRIIQTMEKEEGKDVDGTTTTTARTMKSTTVIIHEQMNFSSDFLFPLLALSRSHSHARGRAHSLRCLRSERGGSPYGCLCSFCIGEHAIRINNCIQSRSHYIQLVLHINKREE